MKANSVHLTLRQRIYLSMLAVLALSFVATGIAAYYNFTEQEEDYNRQRLSRKEQAVQESMHYFLQQKGGMIPTDSITSFFSDKICELSDVHRLAINLYSLKGDLLISSSVDSLLDLGFSQQIDYTVMKQLSTGTDRAMQARDIDHGQYIMAYWYFRDEKNQPIAITNVRYDKQDIETDELKSFLFQLSTIYAGLFIGASIIAFLLSNYITSSLQKIAVRMKGVNPAAKNEPIEWTSNDEIGALVHEYNRMLFEVETSVVKLAETEREIAWREMAKQVAHEIKNPLTPMKLRVQHLQRSWDPTDVDFTEKLNVFAAAMIEQIDTLSNIATEFSHFAKMPKASEEVVDVYSTLKGCVDLFTTTPGSMISLEPNTPLQALILADKEGLVRVFNNLIKNAFQSIPEEKEGLVECRLSIDGDRVLVDVCDNGSGIPEDMISKIFQPNFTTKTQGTGLGLAMVKNIVNIANGSIAFETKEGKGTCFKLSFPLIQSSQGK